jgi:hypothetical protein
MTPFMLTVLSMVQVADPGPWDGLFAMLLPVLATIAGRYIYEGTQILGSFLKLKLPMAVHAISLVLVNWLLMQLGQFIGMTLPSTLEGFTPEIATAIAMALGQMGWHKISKDNARGVKNTPG